MHRLLSSAAITLAVIVQSAGAQDRASTFVPPGGYQSTTGSTYVEASAERKLQPGQKIARLTERNYAGDTVLQKLTDRVYWVQHRFYNALFYVGDTGVLVMDPLAGGSGKSVLEAIRSVTGKPIAAVVLSHHHADHIGDLPLFVQASREAGIKPRIIATAETAAKLAQQRGTFPQPDEIVRNDQSIVKFEALGLRVIRFARPAHSSDSVAWSFDTEKVLHAPDILNPDQMAFLGFGGAQTFTGYEDGLAQLRAVDFTFLSGGHGNVGTIADLNFMQQYVADLKAAVATARGKVSPAAFFISKYGNHHASARAFRDAADRAVLDLLRPKYGNYYGFEASVAEQAQMVRRAEGE